MSRDINSLTIPQAGWITGRGPVGAWKAARRGAWGTVSKGKPARVAIEAVQRECGIRFTPEQLAAAVAARPWPPRRQHKQPDIASVIASAIAARDEQWRRHLAAKFANMQNGSKENMGTDPAGVADE